MPDQPSVWNIQRLDKSHDRASFDCGKPELNDWLLRLAGQYERRDSARIYVAVREGDLRVLGYYAISNHLVRYYTLPQEQAKGLPIIDIPVVSLGQLAVDKTAQGQGSGAHFLLSMPYAEPLTSQTASALGRLKLMPSTRRPASSISSMASSHSSMTSNTCSCRCG